MPKVSIRVGVWLAIFSLLMVASGALTPQRAHAAGNPGGLGGNWQNPPNHFQVNGNTLTFRVEAHGSPRVGHVNFTANWGNGWQVIARLPGEDFGNSPRVYEYTWDLHGPVAYGHQQNNLQVSFDVYGPEPSNQITDDSGPKNLSPNGVHIGDSGPWYCISSNPPPGQTCTD
jgi:hypothetical protein